MRDIIWTIIVIWVVWKVYETFSSLSKAKSGTSYSQYQKQNNTSYRKEGQIHVESNTSESKKPHFKPGHGEYVDYEEVKE